jgi:predicted RNA methylase
LYNRLRYLLQRPEKGWDPIGVEYANNYAAHEYAHFDQAFFDRVIDHFGPVSGKSLIDLGGGPGQFSIAFAKLGARVTWHDISRQYMKIVQEKAAAGVLPVRSSLGYMEEAEGRYDFLFNRICWCYCINDKAFAKKIYSLLADQGKAYIVTSNEDYERAFHSGGVKTVIWRLQFGLNNRFNLKIGHPNPSHAKLQRLFSRFPFKEMIFERDSYNTTIKLVK